MTTGKGHPHVDRDGPLAVLRYLLAPERGTTADLGGWARRLGGPVGEPPATYPGLGDSGESFIVDVSEWRHQARSKQR